MASKILNLICLYDPELDEQDLLSLLKAQCQDIHSQAGDWITRTERHIRFGEHWVGIVLEVPDEFVDVVNGNMERDDDMVHVSL